jgi:imidazolonepropionase-like amidohydrolase
MATYFANVALFDGNRLRERAGVLTAEGVVAWVGPHARAPREANAAVPVDGTGRTLTPGLIDCHVHLCFDGSPDFVGEAAVTEPYAAVKCVANAARHLVNGVTTVRDLGGFRDVATDVGRAIADGRVPGPRVVASGTALTVTGGHGWNTFARQTDGPDGVRVAVREQIRAGARSIKIVATGGVLTPGIGVDFTAFTPAEVEAAVDEAHKWGVPIAAHAIGRTGIGYCVAAGIDSIEHGAQIDAAIAKEMKERGTFHVPTIAALSEIIGHPEDVPEYAVAKGKQIWEMAQDAFRRSIRAGVRIACGTDAGTPHNPHGSAAKEIVHMVEWGLTPMKALQAATSNAAALLRVDDVTGSVEMGKAADLSLYDGDPLDDPTVLLRPASVWKGGEMVADGSGSLTDEG